MSCQEGTPVDQVLLAYRCERAWGNVVKVRIKRTPMASLGKEAHQAGESFLQPTSLTLNKDWRGLLEMQVLGIRMNHT